jgi:hypothetical protein
MRVVSKVGVAVPVVAVVPVFMVSVVVVVVEVSSVVVVSFPLQELKTSSAANRGIVNN